LSTLHTSLYAIAFGCCVLLLIVAQRSRAAARGRTRYLAMLLALQTLSMAFEWLMANPSTPAKSLWLTGVMALAFLYGPLLWLFARSIDEPAVPRLRDVPRAHLVAIIAGVALLVPLVATTHLGSGFTAPDSARRGVFPGFIHETMLASVAVFALQALFYLRASVRILNRHAGAARALLSDVEDRDLNALRLMIVVVGAHWLVGIARTLHPLLLGKDAGYIILFAAAEVMFMLWAVRELLGAKPAVEPGERRLANELADVKYAKSALDAPARARISRKLADAWSRGMHRDSRLTLRGLCEQLRENPHYVSQVINQDLATSFYDVVNRHRIADAVAALMGDPERPVLEIALEVGFNSKSTFNAAFRQHAGTTPTAFRKATRAAPSEPAG
jgi:AraC-like DNA-binding protein